MFCPVLVQGRWRIGEIISKEMLDMACHSLLFEKMIAPARICAAHWILIPPPTYE